VNVLIFGPPGAGKGTQAKNISKKFNLHQISSGDLLRNEVKKNSEIGKEIESIIAKGDFATDYIVNKLIKNVALDPNYRNRIIYDGYPRNIKQAKNLELVLNSDNQSINFIFFLKVSRNHLEKRILGRVTCQKCNKIFNEFYDDDIIRNHECGSEYLIKRLDDNKDVIINRYEEYIKQTKPVLDFYSSRSYFYEIDGSEKIEVISSKIEQIITG